MMILLNSCFTEAWWWLILNIDYRAHLDLMAVNVTDQSVVKQLCIIGACIWLTASLLATSLVIRCMKLGPCICTGLVYSKPQCMLVGKTYSVEEQSTFITMQNRTLLVKPGYKHMKKSELFFMFWYLLSKDMGSPQTKVNIYFEDAYHEAAYAIENDYNSMKLCSVWFTTYPSINPIPLT